MVSDIEVTTWSGRTQESKNKDQITTHDYGAICDGTYHPLSEKYSNLSDAQAIYPFVTSLSQSIDDVALQKALNDITYHQTLYINGIHVAHSVNPSSADPIIVSNTPERKIVFNGVVIPNNEVKKFILINAEETSLSINADGKKMSLCNLVHVNAPNCLIHNSKVINLYAKEYSAVAFTILQNGHGFKIRDNTVKDIDALGDGTLGNGRGMCRAIAVDLVNPTYTSVIENNSFDRILGEEGDAITIVSKDNLGNYSDCKTTICGNSINNVNRRHVKIQGNNPLVQDNVFQQSDQNILLTNVSNVVDFVEGDGGKIIENFFDGTINFSQISINHSSLSNYSENILISKNNFINLKSANNTKGIIFCSSTGSMKFIITDNNIQCGQGRAISLGRAEKSLVKGNIIDGLDNLNESFLIVSSTVKTSIVDNMFLGGNRRSCILDSASGTIHKDNLNMTESPLINDANGSRESVIINNLCYASSVISGANGYKGNYFYQNFRIDQSDNPYQGPIFLVGENQPLSY